MVSVRYGIVVAATSTRAGHRSAYDKIDDDDLLNQPCTVASISQFQYQYFLLNDDFFFSEGIKGPKYYK